jgi:cystathionine beta-lyase
MISFVLSDKYDRDVFMKSLKVLKLAISLGGAESLLGHPVTMTHGAIPYEERQKLGILDNLLRISVGIEDAETLREDLEQAFQKARK